MDTPAIPSLDLDQAKKWLSLTHLRAPGDHIIHLAHLDRNGNWYGEGHRVDAAPVLLNRIRQLDQQQAQGIYFSCCTMHPGSGNSRKRTDAALLHGLWSDLDMAGPGHQHVPCVPPYCKPGTACQAHVKEKPNGGIRVLPLPPDEEAVAKILDTCKLPPPTVIVHSGGGWYAWWLLDEPVPAQEHEKLSAGWQIQLAYAASQLGYHYGTGVGDLSRVLRVPGTLNRKPEMVQSTGPADCKIIDELGS